MRAPAAFLASIAAARARATMQRRRRICARRRRDISKARVRAMTMVIGIAVIREVLDGITALAGRTVVAVGMEAGGMAVGAAVMVIMAAVTDMDISDANSTR